MAVHNITSRDFRSSMAAVFEMADMGEQVIIRRRQKQAYTLVPISDNDLMISPELQAKIDKAREDHKAGNYVSCRNKEELHAFLDSL